jgi:hypothetical protein
MSAEHACFRQIIARGCVVQVERCTCGTLHLVLGPLSLRLTVPQFQSLLDTLLHAKGSLEQQSDDLDDSQSAGVRLATLLSQSAARGES